VVYADSKARCAARDIPIDYAVLRPSEKACGDRAAARADGRITDYSPHRELYQSFDEVERHRLSDDGASPAEMAVSIVAGLEEGRFRLASGT